MCMYVLVPSLLFNNDHLLQFADPRLLRFYNFHIVNQLHEAQGNVLKTEEAQQCSRCHF